MSIAPSAVGDRQPGREAPFGAWNNCTAAELEAVRAFHHRLPSRDYADDETLFARWRWLPFCVDTIQVRLWNAACEHRFAAYPPGPLAARRFSCMPGTAASVVSIGYSARLILGYSTAPAYAAFFVEHVYDDGRERPVVLDRLEDRTGGLRDVAPKVIREKRFSLVVRCTVRRGVQLYQAHVEVGFDGEALIVRTRPLNNRLAYHWRAWTRRRSPFRTADYSDG